MPIVSPTHALYALFVHNLKQTPGWHGSARTACAQTHVRRHTLALQVIYCSGFLMSAISSAHKHAHPPFSVGSLFGFLRYAGGIQTTAYNRISTDQTHNPRTNAPTHPSPHPGARGNGLAPLNIDYEKPSSLNIVFDQFRKRKC